MNRLGLIIIINIFTISGVLAADLTYDEEFQVGKGNNPSNVGSEPVPGMKMLDPSYKGNGCPKDSAATLLTPDGKTLSVLFSEFINDVDASNKLASKRCLIKVPFQVPKGYQMTVVKVNFRGYNYLPQGAESQLSTFYRIMGPDGKQVEASAIRGIHFDGPLDDDYNLNSLTNRRPLFSPCGKNFDFIATFALQTKTPGEEASSTIDSLDQTLTQQNVSYHLFWKKCGGNSAQEQRERDKFDKHRGRDGQRRRVDGSRGGNGRPSRF